jgi:glycosyltransferase involved in cell wall biosynthesis
LKFSIIVFCFNEAESLPTVVKAVDNVMLAMHCEYEVIIVDDGSTDNTIEIAKKIQNSSSNVRVIRHSVNKGIGQSLKTGYLECNFEYVCAIPGDGQFDVNELKIVTPFGIDTFYSFYRPQTNYSAYRAFLSWSNRIFNQHILGIYLRDVNWVKVYRKDHIIMTFPELNSSLIESEICAKLYKCNILPIEIPSKYLTREYGISRGGSWKTLKKAIGELFPLWWCIAKFKHPH